jgi:hypothetical protein
MNVVTPRRKKSQWNPGGLRSGNSDPCAMRDYARELGLARLGTARRGLEPVRYSVDCEVRLINSPRRWRQNKRE